MSDTAERFENFHADNPLVYETLVRLSKEWVSQHGKKLGIRVIWEVARWEIIKQTKNSDYKLNDHLTGYYARLIMAQEPELANMFVTRASEADNWITSRGSA